MWVCGACAKPRNITSDDLIEGAKIIGAATAVEALVNSGEVVIPTEAYIVTAEKA